MLICLEKDIYNKLLMISLMYFAAATGASL